MQPMSVTALTNELKGTLESRFFQVTVQGEISNFRPAASGHLYFTLKDAGASISAVMFIREAMGLRFRPADGMEVTVSGRVSIYAPRGQYQIVCARMDKAGDGRLAREFEALKARLLAEGLFDPTRKKALPFLPRRIGLVTSPSGAALHDFLRVLHSRFPVPVLLAPSSVQGDRAPAELIGALRRLDHSGLVDLIVLTRGGGSMEDLWAFNDERLARAIAGCAVPVISAVGHEVDFTIADFAADRRCATPTDAARVAVPVKRDLLAVLERDRKRLTAGTRGQIFACRAALGEAVRRMGTPQRLITDGRLGISDALGRMEGVARSLLTLQQRTLSSRRERLERAHPRLRLVRASARFEAALPRLESSARGALRLRRDELDKSLALLRLHSPALTVQSERIRLQHLKARLEKAARNALTDARSALAKSAAGLDALSPLAVLSRGYALVFRQGTREVIRSADQLQKGAFIDIMLADQSTAAAQVTSSAAAEEHHETSDLSGKGAASSPSQTPKA